MNIINIIDKTKIIPIGVFKDVSSALKTTEILIKNSIPIIEITVRTEVAFKCIEEISKNFPEILVGAGSILSTDMLNKAMEVGAKFAMSPCLDMDILNYSSTLNIKYIPGFSTPSELNISIKKGLDIIKLFPTTPLGGVKYIKAIVAPFKMMNFHLIPTGGIDENNILEFIKTERVIACGTSYIVDKNLVEKEDFLEIENRIIRIKNKIELRNS